MSYTYPDAAPLVVPIGVDTLISQRVRLTADESIPTVDASSSEITVHAPDGTVLATIAPPTWDAAGGALSATLSRTATTGQAASPKGYALFKPAIGGAQVVSRRRLILVPREARPSLLSSDVKARYAEVEDIRTDAEIIADIAEAWEELRAELQAADLQLDLVTDTEWTARLHRVLTAHMCFRKAAEDFQSDDYATKADAYLMEFRRLLQDSAPYDADANDTEDSRPAVAADDAWFWGGRRVS